MALTKQASKKNNFDNFLLCIENINPDQCLKLKLESMTEIRRYVTVRKKELRCNLDLDKSN
jgi:hypothetical protein